MPCNFYCRKFHEFYWISSIPLVRIVYPVTECTLTNSSLNAVRVNQLTAGRWMPMPAVRPEHYTDRYSGIPLFHTDNALKLHFTLAVCPLPSQILNLRFYRNRYSDFLKREKWDPPVTSIFSFSDKKFILTFQRRF